MRVLAISGSHPRHLAFFSVLEELGIEGCAIVMQREELVPVPDPSLGKRDKVLYVRHFCERQEAEERFFGKPDSEKVFRGFRVHRCLESDLSTHQTVDFVQAFDPDVALIFGTDIIRDPLFTALPEYKINIHLGLSPWYRGSATLFWPHYFLEPQFCGATMHLITSEADAGDVLHQSCPKLVSGDGIHDHAARVVLRARADIKRILEIHPNREAWVFQPQRGRGKLFLRRDFKPAHLRLIYETFENRIVDAWLDGQLGGTPPRLVSAFNPAAKRPEL